MTQQLEWEELSPYAATPNLLGDYRIWKAWKFEISVANGNYHLFADIPDSSVWEFTSLRDAKDFAQSIYDVYPYADKYAAQRTVMIYDDRVAALLHAAMDVFWFANTELLARHRNPLKEERLAKLHAALDNIQMPVRKR